MGEKPYKSEFGGNIKAQLFEQFNPITVLTLKTRIQKALETFERRVNLLKVEVTPNFDRNELTVSIVVKVLNIPEPVTVDITLERIR
jgi:phage baseplate assembly protein W